MKSSHCEKYVSVDKVVKSVQTYKKLKNPHYENVEFPNSYTEYVRSHDPVGYSNFLEDVENNLVDEIDCDTLDKDEEKYMDMEIRNMI